MWKCKKQNRRIKFNFGAKAICALFLIVGAFLIALSNMNFGNSESWWSSWGKASANSAGTTFLVAGVVSFLMEVSTLKSFFSDSMKNILNDDFPLEAYSNDNLIRFRNRISAHLLDCGMEPEVLSKDTIYSYEDQVLQLSKSRYYEYHKAIYYVDPDEEKKRIHIKATVDYKVINKFNEISELVLKTKTYALNEDEAKNNFKLTELSINDQNIGTEELVEIEKIKKPEGSNFYDYKVKVKKDLGREKESKIHMAYEYFIPLYDRMQNYKMTIPCEKMEHVIIMNGEWRLRGSAYAAFYFKQGEPDSKYAIEQVSPGIIRIKFNDWAFPGSGYSVYYDKNE